MNKPESIRENEKNKILWDSSEIPSADADVKTQKNGQISGPCQRTEKVMEYESDTNCSRCTWNGPKRIGKGFGKSGDQRKD